MKVTYIHHSSFLVETDNAYLLFDYVGGELPKFQEEKPLVLLVSHRHGDHFSPIIFDLAKTHGKIWYIISDDIWQRHVPEELYSKTYFVDPGKVLNLDIEIPIRVSAYRSTDEGVAFLVYCDEKQIYHAGDLNNWMWRGESHETNEKMCQNYRMEIEKLSSTFLDVAFLPLDGRQEDWFYLGIDDFLTRVEIGCVFPMHFWDDFSIISQFKSLPCAQNYKEKIMEIKAEGDTFSLSE